MIVVLSTIVVSGFRPPGYLPRAFAWPFCSRLSRTGIQKSFGGEIPPNVKWKNLHLKVNQRSRAQKNDWFRTSSVIGAFTHTFLSTWWLCHISLQNDFMSLSVSQLLATYGISLQMACSFLLEDSYSMECRTKSPESRQAKSRKEWYSRTYFPHQ